MTDHASAKAKDIAELMDISDSRARTVLARLVEKEVVVTEGNNRNRVYKLQA